ncbi:MAG: hypothetical protein AB7G75_24455 [Candidatus Binatia bacterium]
MGILYYLTVSLGLFVACWMVAGGQLTQLMFVAIHLFCVAAVLLLYAREISRSRFVEARELPRTESPH